MPEFVIRVPDYTPQDQPVFLAGDGSELGNWSAHGVPLQQHPDGTHRVHLDLPADFHGRFLATLGRWRAVEGDGEGRERSPNPFHGSRSVEHFVHGWGRTSIHYHNEFASRFLAHPRTVSVWLPPGYDLDPHRRHPVLYMHDGQNLFDPDTAFAGNPWYADEVAEREVRASRIEPLLIVGVANSPDRLREYGPRRIGQDSSEDISSEYGRFLVEEVKPYIDATYRTQPGPEHTGVAGSSMGGLISLHLCKWYPNVFRRCAAMSPSLWWDREYFLQTLDASSEWLDGCRLWLDMGSREGGNEAGMRSSVDRTLRLSRRLARAGMKEGEQFVCEIVEGGGHNETAWRGRFDRALRFLWGR